ncbi:hypothetical protein C497_03980 [Halalkalicoccus jeotgali B3]|uniref:Uncharacterized protein n=1 Tax=Halalkalicoccus jeotgali (strain DSM 18796 / CECT 7217 / JCM 14584 / KCTC 4019 / B3) TaxID=795797 RepID=D8J9Z1_HALJB|nr:hypothetical protein HacjB3_05610 [Halalkalicoccus jeotgali B3]ELY40086.1 hypothetical protein C497_03980 [Halalkalicoccus jeotgali B3]
MYDRNARRIKLYFFSPEIVPVRIDELQLHEGLVSATPRVCNKLVGGCG